MNLADYRAVNDQYFPFEIVLSDTSSRQEVSIYYEQVELNPPLPDTLFTLAPINGVQEKEIDVDALRP
jgi:outer membrane lipoprotein-sorting protein